MGMLVISRRDGESLMIEKDIEVRVLSIVGNQVRLGIKAPKEMKVYRSELRERFEGEGLVEIVVVDGETSVAA